MRKLIRFQLILFFLIAMPLTVLPLSEASAQDCGCMDVVFAIDDTGSMGPGSTSGAIGNVRAGAAAIVSDIIAASGGDYQLGLTTFKDAIEVDIDLSNGTNAAAVQAAIAGLSASGGGGLPEASDETLNTIINGLAAAGRSQDFDFNGTFRADCVKIIVLITDALPGGFDDTYTVTVDDVNANTRATQAAAAGIKISAIYVPTSGSPSGLITPIMSNYASTTGGVYMMTLANGSGTSAAIEDIIEGCGEEIATCTKGFWKNHSEEWGDLVPQVMPAWGGGMTYLQILWTPPSKGDASVTLAHAYIAAVLNSGAPAGTLADAEVMLSTYPVGSGDLKAGKDALPDREVALDLAEMLQQFNESVECSLSQAG